MSKQHKRMIEQYEELGYLAYPSRRNYPAPGTAFEKAYLKGWNKRKWEETESSDQEWAFGRNTFATDY